MISVSSVYLAAMDLIKSKLEEHRTERVVRVNIEPCSELESDEDARVPLLIMVSEYGVGFSSYTVNIKHSSKKGFSFDASREGSDSYLVSGTVDELVAWILTGDKSECVNAGQPTVPTSVRRKDEREDS